MRSIPARAGSGDEARQANLLSRGAQARAEKNRFAVGPQHSCADAFFERSRVRADRVIEQPHLQFLPERPTPVPTLRERQARAAPHEIARHRAP